MNRLGKSYVTQGDRKICDLLPLSPATVVQQRPPGWFPGFPISTSPGPASFPIGKSGYTTNQNGGDLYRYENETSKEGHMGLTISDFFYLFKVL